MKIFFNWLLFLLFVVACLATIKYRHYISGHLPERGTMTGLQVIVFSLAFSFMWVEVLKWGSVKPFNCIKCLTGWVALILAFTFHVGFWMFYLPVGVTIGAMFEGIKMRWL